MLAIQLLKASISPYGRCNRTGLLHVTSALIAAQVLLSVLLWLAGSPTHGAFGLSFNAVLIWAGFCATAKRLHDIGLSAWWIPVFFASLILWSFIQTFLLFMLIGPSILDIFHPMFWLSIAGILTPVLAVTIWLHYAPSDPQPNSYGLSPGANGFSASSRPPVWQDTPSLNA